MFVWILGIPECYSIWSPLHCYSRSSRCTRLPFGENFLDFVPTTPELVRQRRGQFGFPQFRYSIIFPSFVYSLEVACTSFLSLACVLVAPAAYFIPRLLILTQEAYDTHLTALCIARRSHDIFQ
ncbi:hypothetical protein BU26DRAFT_38967 [Trematosphaeria pertusa]|uniref:Uncharacterized protein n=1 Tax=Trematosphaeria pertusa TaxID=390896 RepID=A0A6A6J304_9PLEO|nr:uncharacterized protein BU26DRAFT_38967 [Trematosphaeria pertusa]KAF2257225.1 hypothetical protein BU26DRAFT_38967 [Trematosphaeria pertusa]